MLAAPPDVVRGLLSPTYMTRSYRATPTRRRRRITQPMIRVTRAPRDPSITRLGFAFYRLVRVLDREADWWPYAAIEVHGGSNAMAVFAAAA